MQRQTSCPKEKKTASFAASKKKTKKQKHKYREKTRSLIYHQCKPVSAAVCLFIVIMKMCWGQLWVWTGSMQARSSHRVLQTCLLTGSFQDNFFFILSWYGGCVGVHSEGRGPRMRARGGRGTGLLWPSAPAPGPAWVAGSCWSSAPPLWTTRTSQLTRQTNPTASAWWCDAGRLRKRGWHF